MKVGSTIHFGCPPGLVFRHNKFIDPPEEIIQCFENGAAPPPEGDVWPECVTGGRLFFSLV